MMSSLWELCESGSLPEVRAALARGEDVNGKDEDDTSSNGIFKMKRGIGKPLGFE